MTPEQYLKFLEYFKNNNSWNDDSFYLNACEKLRPCFKYVDSKYDSRDNTIWSITLYDGVNVPDKQIGIEGTFKIGDKKEVTFRIENNKDIEALYNFLNISNK